MADPKRETLKVERRKAVLAAVVHPDRKHDQERVLDEIRGLATTAGVRIVGELVQFRETPHPATGLGKGKSEELRQLVDATDAQLVIFDNNLTPAQGKKLEDVLNVPIVDRSEVILDIFATHARTYEAMLQVELAQLLYFRTRLKRMWTHLERIQGGIGTGRGPGEKQLETDRRLIDKRVAELKRKLASVEKRRERTVAGRREFATVSLVGYTNAGKSTLMNALTGSDVLVANKLFATLDTRTRKWSLPIWGDVLLSDTVGFVRDLPHHLVASFKSTLEEARHADLLLHVADASNPQVEEQIDTVYSVLEEIGVPTENVLLVLNKVDMIEERWKLDVLRRRHPHAVTVSAAKKQGLDKLVQVVANRMAGEYIEAEIQTSAGNGRLLAYLARHAQVTNTEYTDSRVTLNCLIPRRFAIGLDDEDTTVTVRDDHPSLLAETPLATSDTVN